MSKTLITEIIYKHRFVPENSALSAHVCLLTLSVECSSIEQRYFADSKRIPTAVVISQIGSITIFFSCQWVDHCAIVIRQRHRETWLPCDVTTLNSNTIQPCPVAVDAFQSNPGVVTIPNTESHYCFQPSCMRGTKYGFPMEVCWYIVIILLIN